MKDYLISQVKDYIQRYGTGYIKSGNLKSGITVINKNMIASFGIDTTQLTMEDGCITIRLQGIFGNISNKVRWIKRVHLGPGTIQFILNGSCEMIFNNQSEMIEKVEKALSETMDYILQLIEE